MLKKNPNLKMCVFVDEFDFFGIKENDNKQSIRDSYICDNTVRISFSYMAREHSSMKYVPFISKVAQQ